MLMLCTECKKYDVCKSLCSTQEAYVNQDHISRSFREILYPEKVSFDDDQSSLDDVYYSHGLDASLVPLMEYDQSLSLSFLSSREKECLMMFYVDGRKLREIGELLHINLKTVHEYIRRAKRKCIVELS